MLTNRSMKIEVHQRHVSSKVVSAPPSSTVLTSYVDLDRLEMALQAREYESRHGQNGTDPIPSLNLQQFFDSSIPKIEHAEVKGWGAALEESRQRDIPKLS
jgi:hypothetical protein